MALLLSDREVRSLLSMQDAIAAVEDAFRARGMGKTQMPSKQYLFFERHEGDLRVMPGYIQTTEAAGVKIVNSHPRNPSEHGLPSVLATVIIVDPATGKPTALMGANSLTAIRTGAAGGVAASYMARSESSVVGLIGAGVQARSQLAALGEVLQNISVVKVYDRDRARAESFCKDPWPPAWSVSVASTPAEAVTSTDMVVTTTPSRSPIVRRSWVSPGTHINAIGADAPGKQEMDAEILANCRLVVDDWDQASHGGEINVPLKRGQISRDDIAAELSDVICGRTPGRTSGDEITLFDSTGLAIQDVAVAALVYERAKSKGAGAEVDIWSS